MAHDEEAGFTANPKVARRLFTWVCIAVAGLFAGQQMDRVVSSSFLAPAARDPAEACALPGRVTLETPVLRRGRSLALSRLLASRLQKASATPELESWALSLPSSESSSAPDEAQKTVDALVADVRAKARTEFVEKCVDIVSGKRLSSFGPAYEDWVLFNSFFRANASSSRHAKYGSGFYVDVNDGDPVAVSPAFFFDACLGWQGVCIPVYGGHTDAYAKNRTCKVLPPLCSQKAGKDKDMVCEQLGDVLSEEKLEGKRIDLVTVMTKNAPHIVRCFPFFAFDAPLWNVMVKPNEKWRWRGIDLAMGAAGYWKAPSLMEQKTKKGASDPGFPLGYRYSNIFMRWPRPGVALDIAEGITVPTMVIGPQFREGQPLYGQPFPSCDPFAKEGNTSCPDSIPTIDAEFERDRKHPRLCPEFKGTKLRLSW